MKKGTNFTIVKQTTGMKKVLLFGLLAIASIAATLTAVTLVQQTAVHYIAGTISFVLTTHTIRLMAALSKSIPK